MTDPTRAFIEQSERNALNETANSKEHFVSLCLSLREAAVMRADLKQRTLAKLYNRRPDWLTEAHRRLDEAVVQPMAGPRT
jgi:hypothetical protein